MAKPPEQTPPASRWGLWFDQVARALTSGLTVSENLAQAWVDVTVTVGAQATTAQLAVDLKGRVPYGISVERVVVISTQGTSEAGAIVSAVSVHWEPATFNGRTGIRVLNVYGLAAGTKATLTLLVKAE